MGEAISDRTCLTWNAAVLQRPPPADVDDRRRAGVGSIGKGGEHLRLVSDVDPYAILHIAK